MEIFARQSICLEQTSMKNHMGCERDMGEIEHAVIKRPAPGPRNVICPKPRRVTRTPCTVDSLEKISTPKSDLPALRKEPSLDILRIFLSKDDVEDDGDGQTGSIFGSPPVRSDNPLVNDVQFVHQTSILAPPTLRNSSYIAVGSSERVARVPSRGKSSFGGKPLVRVEGFSCGSPESSCIVASPA